MPAAQNEKSYEEFNVIVNGRPKTVTEAELSFMDVVRLAHESPPFGQNTLFTVTYRNDSEHQQGTLVDGQTVTVRNGTIFNVTATDKS